MKNHNYVSETTNFINSLLTAQPQIKDLQQKLRATWWDHEFDPIQQDVNYDNLKTPAYTYFSY